jgi:hypothetical protein
MNGCCHDPLSPADTQVASLDSGPDRPLLGFFQIQFWNAWDMDGEHEAHFARRSGAERFASHGPMGTTVSLLRWWQRQCLARPAGPLIPNGP